MVVSFLSNLLTTSVDEFYSGQNPWATYVHVLQVVERKVTDS